MKFVRNIVKQEIEKLKKKIFSKAGDYTYPYDYVLGLGLSEEKPLEERLRARLDDLKGEHEVLEKKFNALLAHFKIEYVEITEKNGGTKVKEIYRKVKKSKKSKSKDYYDED